MRATGTAPLLAQTPETLAAFAEAHGLPRFLPAQLLRWIHERRVIDPSAMTDLSKPARLLVAERFASFRGTVRAHQVADDGTQKLLLGWDVGETSTHPAAPEPCIGSTPDAEPDEAGAASLPVLAAPSALDDGGRTSGAVGAERRTECVLIPTESRKTACVSSQVGCPVGCAFCASGLGGLEGNLDAGQIVEQVWRLAGLPGVGRISHVVFMGMGEPLANFTAVTEAIRILNAPWGMGISARRITISTVGLPAAIRRLCSFEIPVTLALSLHAPTDELRRTIIPWAEYATIEELLDACDEWFEKTGREITLEYILLGGVNDRPEHAERLAELARRLRANVNLIRYNEVRGIPFQRPATEDVRRFQTVLRNHAVNAHIRRSRGRDIAAACGQLRHERR
ncbi:MAG TPA: 23S rRNA (adenine(2503)-C(2))-methyltransferase RlmN [Phycisphaerales bacterium]|nr:23S rRNA (adenine(2503)-C(2))-methyltransferase RlmN [Phycisphaerales bacterium]HMP37652.1 23S rRNA (adenine(2503)-C(2))-methyltransferase RlmN [Phycisphaerales bacterium]